jgi:pimeloyl-ACP methyl ester carboxylesterase
LVIVGTEDIFTPAANSLMIVDKIPSAWLVQIRDAGHGLMNQYPNQFNRMVSTFLETVR